jgi:hypothetical protein
MKEFFDKEIVKKSNILKGFQWFPDTNLVELKEEYKEQPLYGGPYKEIKNGFDKYGIIYIEGKGVFLNLHRELKSLYPGDWIVEAPMEDISIIPSWDFYDEHFGYEIINEN